MKQSKAAATILGSADCLLLMVESMKISTCNIHDGKAAASQMHISEWCAPKNQGHFMNWFLDSFFLAFSF